MRWPLMADDLWSLIISVTYAPVSTSNQPDRISFHTGSILGMAMPLISEFFGIKIYMYWNDHYPEHFHAEYGKFKALISINQSVIIKGSLPSKQMKLVLAWCEIHKEELLNNWIAAQKNEDIIRIDPLN